MQSLSDKIRIKFEVNNKNQSDKPSNIWKLKSIHVNNPQDKK